MTRFLASLSPAEARFLLDDWRFWARDEQCPPADDQWTTWLFLGGRGAGKTRAGAEWLRSEISTGAARRVALVGETLADAREVMVEGPSGLLALSWGRERPRYQPTRRRLVWASGATARLFSAEDPDSLRGHQFDRAWSDELAKWRHAQEAWDMLQLGLRLGRKPRQMATTTPRPLPLLKQLLVDKTVTVTRASTQRNRANLAPAFFTQILARFEGTRLGRQELDAEILEDDPNGLWRWDLIERARVGKAPPLRRVVVAVDPPASAGPDAASCGIIVAGLGGDDHGYVLADRTVQGLSPLGWARVVAATAREAKADRVVVEVNQGGDLVKTVLRQIDPALPLTAVRATRDKRTRAEPVAALYEQGHVHHVGAFPKLEDALLAFDAHRPGFGAGIDRVDALVWALTDLILTRSFGEPRLRLL